jgi:hypothetical protein
MKITLSTLIIAGALIAAAIAFAGHWTTEPAGDDRLAAFPFDRWPVGGADRWTDLAVECGYEHENDPPVRAGLRRCVYK